MIIPNWNLRAVCLAIRTLLDQLRNNENKVWLEITSSYNWPTEVSWDDNTASSTHSDDSRPEADIHLDDVFDKIHGDRRHKSNRKESDCQSYENSGLNKSVCPFTQTLVHRSGDEASCDEEFDEGPFLRMIFKLLAAMPDQPYQVNLHLTSIISKLALIPHPYLHEYLLNPDLPTAKNTPTLFKTLQEVARKLTMEVPRIHNYKRVIEATRLQLMSDDPSYDEVGSHNRLVECLIVFEEFCKELASIAFVKHQHQR